MKPPLSTILPLAGALLLAGLAYWYFFTGEEQARTLTPSSTPTAAQSAFQSLASELQPISFPTSIFSDPRFMGLVSLATPITPEAPGRLDPFAPLGAAGR